jgi:hypothetical protein
LKLKGARVEQVFAELIRYDGLRLGEYEYR